MIGNVVSWWLCVMGMSIIVGVFGADQLANRRGIQPISTRALVSRDRADLAAVRNRMYNTTGFFLLAWACHYMPFFTMNRQLCVSHLMPADV